MFTQILYVGKRFVPFGSADGQTDRGTWRR